MKVLKSLHTEHKTATPTYTIYKDIPGIEHAFNDLLALASQVSGSLICGVSFLDENNEWIIVSRDNESSYLQQQNSFFNYLIQHPHELAVTNALFDERFCDDRLVTNSPGIRFFAALPLYNEFGAMIAFIFLMDNQPCSLTQNQWDCLHILNKQLYALMQQLPNLYIALKADLTSRKITEESLVKSLKEISDYKYALDESAIVAITNQKGIITYVNDNFCKISKYSREELIGQDHRIINSGHHSKDFIKDLWMTIANGDIWKGEIKNKAKDGSTYWEDTVIVPFLNDAGKPYQYVAIRTDITQKKIIEEDFTRSLREISDYKYALNESSIVAITDQNGIIKYVNKNFCQISGYSKNEMLGMDHRVVNSGFHSKEFFTDLWATITKGKIWKGEFKNKAKDGSIFWVNTVIVPFLTEKGKAYQYVALATDITPVKLSQEKILSLNETLAINEKKFRTLIENNDDIITLLDRNLVTQYRSPSTSRITGWDTENIIARNKFGRIHPDDAETLKQVIFKVIEEPGVTVDITFRTLHKQGHYIWLEGTITNLLHDPSLNGLVLNLRDVTERKKSEELLVEKNKQISDILERIQDGFIVLDNNFNYTYANKSIGAMFGMDTSSLIGKNVLEIFPEAAESGAYKAFYLARQTQQYQMNIDYYTAFDLWQESHIYPSREGLSIFIRDISKQKKAEHELTRVHEQLSFHLANTPLALVEWDKDLIVTNWSAQAQKMFGYSEEEIIGKRFSDLNLIYEEDAVTAQTVKDKLRSGEFDRYKSSYRINTKYGTVIYCEWYTSVLKNKEGEILSIMGLVQDVTERNTAEQALRVSEERFDAFMNASPAVAWILDENGRHIYMNNSWEKLFKLKKEQWIGKTMFDLLPKTIAEKLVESNNQVIKTGQAVAISETIAIDGKQYFANTFKFPFKSSTGQLLLGGMAIDVTEQKLAEKALKESEEKYRALIEEAIDGIIVFSTSKHKFITVNKKMTELLGYTKEELLGMHHTNLLLQSNILDESIALDWIGKQDSVKMERVLHRKDGTSLPVEVSIKLMPDKNYLAFVSDITERKKAELEIKEFNEGLENMVAERTSQLETANKDLEAFSYSVSHDLRAPLRAVNGYASILEEDYSNVLNEEGKRLINEIRQNADKMGTLIDDLLTFSRMGRKPIVTTLINMDGMCITAFDEVNTGNKNNLELILHPLSGAVADYSLIKQVMINLLSNAIKFSSKQSKPRIEISSSINEKEIIFSIKDNGVGFDMKYVNKLFGVFQRLHSTDEFEGTGVGLATVHRIITKHGGNVWAESFLNEGATFYFSLPTIPVT